MKELSDKEPKRHNYVREEYTTEYKQLNNKHFIIYCTGCGYVALDTHLGDNNKRQESLPEECI